MAHGGHRIDVLLGQYSGVRTGRRNASLEQPQQHCITAARRPVTFRPICSTLGTYTSLLSLPNDCTLPSSHYLMTVHFPPLTTR